MVSSFSRDVVEFHDLRHALRPSLQASWMGFSSLEVSFSLAHNSIRWPDIPMPMVAIHFSLNPKQCSHFRWVSVSLSTYRYCWASAMTVMRQSNAESVHVICFCPILASQSDACKWSECECASLLSAAHAILYECCKKDRTHKKID